MRITCLALLTSAAIALAGVSALAAIADSPEAARPLAVGARAPVVALKRMDGVDFDLAAAFAAKPTVLIFYRGGWCPFCNRHLAALAEHENDLRALGYQIIAISPESGAALSGLAEKQHLRYQLLSDSAFQAGPAYGVAYRVPAATARGYRDNGITLSRIPGSEDSWLPVPSAFLISRDGVIRFVYSNPDYRVRIPVADLLAAAKAAAP
jgi:peroxiredoxin